MILHVRLLLSTTPNLPFLSLSYQSLMAKVLEEYPIISALDLRKKKHFGFSSFRESLLSLKYLRKSDILP